MHTMIAILYYRMFYYYTDVHNNFVKLKVDLASSSIICEFLQDSNDTKECSIIYGHGEDCDDLSLNSQLESSTHKIIRVGLPGLIYHKPSTYCFVATASSASFVATVKGTFRTGIIILLTIIIINNLNVHD